MNSRRVLHLLRGRRHFPDGERTAHDVTPEPAVAERLRTYGTSPSPDAAFKARLRAELLRAHAPVPGRQGSGRQRLKKRKDSPMIAPNIATLPRTTRRHDRRRLAWVSWLPAVALTILAVASFVTLTHPVSSPLTTIAPNTRVGGHGRAPRAVAVSSAQAVVAHSPRLIAVLRGHTNHVEMVAFSPNSKILASGSNDTTIRLWNVRTHRQIAKWVADPSGVTALAISPDGKTLATGGVYGTILLWDEATHRQIGAPLLGHNMNVQRLAFSPSGKVLVSTGLDGTVRFWDVATHREIGAPVPAPGDTVWDIAISPDGKTLATACDDDTIRLWNMDTHRQIGAPLTGNTEAVESVAFSPDGKTLASGGTDSTIRLWNVTTHRQIGAPLTGHTDVVYGVAFSPDGTILASAGGNDDTVRLWNVATHRQIGAPLAGHTGMVTWVAISPDGSTLASASYDTTIRLWALNR